MSCGEPAFWNEIHASKDKVQEQVSLSDQNPFDSMGSLPDADEARIVEFFKDVDRREAEQNAYDESYVESQKPAEEPTSRAYVDQQMQLTIPGDSPAMGDITLNTHSNRLMVHDGSNWTAAEPNGMVDALVVQDASGEQLDVFLGATICKLAEEIDDMAYFRKNLERGLEPAKKRLAFDAAMKGI